MEAHPLVMLWASLFGSDTRFCRMNTKCKSKKKSVDDFVKLCLNITLKLSFCNCLQTRTNSRAVCSENSVFLTQVGTENVCSILAYVRISCSVRTILTSEPLLCTQAVSKVKMTNQKKNSRPENEYCSPSYMFIRSVA